MDNNLDTLFNPKNIAVIGASPKDGDRVPGNSYIRGSISQNFKGRIFPVHPSGQSILGYPTYTSVRDIPDEVDLAIFTIPASAVLAVMEDCVAKGVQFVHFFTAGFSETGLKEDAELERKMLDIAQQGGMRILGPNCMGLYCPEGGLAFQPMFPTDSGPLGFFSQSGQFTGMFIHLADAEGLHFQKAVSIGNAIDLKAHHFLSYFAQDEKIKVIGSYLEGLTDGREFFEIAREVTREKPLVIYKGGQTEGGARATRSHTAAIAGSNKIWLSMCKQTGIIPVQSLEEMACTMSALHRMVLPKSKNAAVFGGAGGGSVATTDIAEKEGLRVPVLAPQTIEKMKEIIPRAGSSVMNPLDIGPQAFFGGKFPQVIEYLRDDPNIDALIFLQPIGMVYRFMGREGIEILSEVTDEMQKQLKKPIFPCVEIHRSFGVEAFANDVIARYHKKGLATFPSFEMAARVMNSICNYQTYLSTQQNH